MTGHPIAFLGARLAAQRGQLLPWAAVCFGVGVGAFFWIRFEPSPEMLWAALLGAVGLVFLARFIAEDLRPLVHGIAILALGFAVAGFRTNALAAPQLEFRFYGPIEGRIVKIDRSASDKMRLTLDQVRLGDVAPGRTPPKVRVSLHGDQAVLVPEPGMIVMMTGHLSPPQGPVEPGGFDFQRAAWFQGLGAVGYTRNPALVLEPPKGWGLFVHRVRMRLSAFVQSKIDGESGAVAAAILSGDRSAIGQDVVQDLRRSNLAHLLAISGLHMGLMTGFIFASLRVGLAAVPYVALRYPIRKWAAFIALLAGAGYLVLSGGNVATERAFIMVAVMLIAIMLDRRALTLRSVAMAAIIVLMLRPEALTGPGFQMSFAATTALVAVFGWLRDTAPEEVPPWRRRLRPVMAVVISSAVAGAATAPIAAAHFNMIAQYGLVANLLSVPVMGTLVIPAAVLAFCLWPLGLSSVGFWVMDLGLSWILGVADRVASIDGATRHVPSPDPIVLPLLALGALVLILWQGRFRFAGSAIAALAFVIWAGVERPDLLISDSGKLVGLRGDAGRALSKPRGDGFVARSWMENDGDPVSQEIAAERAGFIGERSARGFRLGTHDFVVLSGKGAPDAVAGACASGAKVIYAGKGQAACAFLDVPRLAQQGAVAIWLSENGSLTSKSAREVTGARLWNTRALAKARVAEGVWPKGLVALAAQ